VGSIRRECLDHVIVLGERHLLQILKSYFAHYHRARTHLSLGKDAPSESRPAAEHGKIVELPEVAGSTIATSGARPDRRNVRHADIDLDGHPSAHGRRRPRSDADHALDVGALAREHAFALTLRRGSRSTPPG